MKTQTMAMAAMISMMISGAAHAGLGKLTKGLKGGASKAIGAVKNAPRQAWNGYTQKVYTPFEQKVLMPSVNAVKDAPKQAWNGYTQKVYTPFETKVLMPSVNAVKDAPKQVAQGFRSGVVKPITSKAVKPVVRTLKKGFRK